VGSRIAHTAEHAFIGALQKTLGQTMKVRKVEHKKDGNTAFIVIPQLDVDTVVRAEEMVNSLIAEGRAVAVRTYPSLEEARRSNPSLRANEERIAGEVRVVEIEGHDLAACAMEHASNLRECDFFLVTRLSRSGGEYEVDFVVGQQAKERAVALSARMIKVCEELGANINTVENTARKLRSENESNSKKLKALSREKLAGIRPETSGRVTIYKGMFSGLADEQVQEFAGEQIRRENTLVLVANATEQEMANVVLARNEKLAGIDLNRLFKEFAGTEGRGGGKPHFVTGVVRKEVVGRVIEEISEKIAQAGQD
jgi:alanyl-tRNA synthetase